VTRKLVFGAGPVLAVIGFLLLFQLYSVHSSGWEWRLERDGLVERASCENDRRALFIKLTNAGRERYADARPTQRRVLREEGSDCLEVKN